MRTQCNQEFLEFHPLGGGGVRGQFGGGAITSDAGGLLLREVEKRTGIIAQFAACFRDHRNRERIEPTVEELVAQRVYGLALGYEDLNDHDQLRHDPLLAMLAEKPDPSGEIRTRERDQGKALAGKSTLNRLELTGEVVSEEERYKKIAMDQEAVDRMLVEVFLQAHREAPQEIVLDLDATDDSVHGNQEGRFFHGYYGHDCDLPLYIFCGDFLLGARLRPSHIDASAGTEGHRTGAGAVCHDAPQAAQDRGADSDYRAAGWGVAGGRVSVRRLLPAGLCPTPRPALALLKKAGGSLAWSSRNIPRRDCADS